MEEERARPLGRDPVGSTAAGLYPDLRVGIVGAGFVGRVHARSARLAGARLAGVASSTPDSAAAAAPRARHRARVRDRRGAGRLRRHRRRPRVRPEPSAPAARAAALESGKHVVCEKPVALDAAGAGELVEARARRSWWPRFPSSTATTPPCAKPGLGARAGSLGDLRLLHGGYLQDWLLAPSDDNWRVDAELGGPSRAFADIGSTGAT